MVRMNGKKTNARAAWIAADSPVMDAVAKQIYAAITASARANGDTGEYAKSFEVEDDYYRSIRDRVVYTRHPAAPSIEFGRRTKNGGSTVGQMNVANVYHQYPKFRYGKS